MEMIIKIYWKSKYDGYLKSNSYDINQEILDSGLLENLDNDPDVVEYSIYKLEKEVRKNEISRVSR